MRSRTVHAAGVMSVALVAAARVARDARPRTRLAGLPESERWDEDPARFQTTAVMAAVVLESKPALPAEEAPEAESVVAEAEAVLALADEPVPVGEPDPAMLALADELVLTPEPDPDVLDAPTLTPVALLDEPAPRREPESYPEVAPGSRWEPAALAAAPPPQPERDRIESHRAPRRPAAAKRIPEPTPTDTPAPELVAPEVAPRVARLRAHPEAAHPEADWAWTEPWGFEVTASAPARPRPRTATSGRERHRHRRTATAQPTGARPRRGAARQAPERHGAITPVTAPRARPRSPGRGARRRRSGANPMIPLVVIAVAVAVCVWAEFPHPSVTQPRPLHTANAASLSFTPHPSAFALQTIPTAYLHDYWRAADEYGLDWTKLAAVGQIESDQGRSQEAGVSTGTNSAGAAGPAQFISSTWARYGVDADGRGSSNPYDPDDAITAMAAYLKASGAPEDWHTALFAYNHSNAYVDSVLALSRRYLAR